MEHPKVLGPTIMTGTSEVDIGGSGVRLESPINGCILAIKIEMARAGVATTKEADLVVVRLKSNTISVVPYEALSQPINAGTGAEVTPYKADGKWYPVNAPVKIGDKLQITGAEQQACTVHPYVCVTVIFADWVATPQYHSVIGTLTAVGAAAQEYKMTTGIDIVGGSWIKAIYGALFTTTDASGAGCIYKYRISSTMLKHVDPTRGLPPKAGMGDIEFAGQFIPGFLSAGTTADAVAARLTAIEFYAKEGIPIDTPAHIDCYCAASVAFTAAGYFQVQIVYT
jgi:hypothetical protein